MRGKTVNRTCKNKRCKAEFTARQADVNRGWGLFCSKSCKAVHQEKRTGQYAEYLRGESRRKNSDGLDFDDPSWDAHKVYLGITGDSQ